MNKITMIKRPIRLKKYLQLTLAEKSNITPYLINRKISLLKYKTLGVRFIIFAQTGISYKEIKKKKKNKYKINIKLIIKIINKKI